ncbi:MAG: ORF6N domain-containing protein [Chitinophagales bacterium]
MKKAITKYKQEDIENRIYNVWGQQVMLDKDIAEMYDVETKALNQAVKRNIDRFPARFRFQLTEKEFDGLRSQFVTSSSEHGGRRYLP